MSPVFFSVNGFLTPPRELVHNQLSTESKMANGSDETYPFHSLDVDLSIIPATAAEKV
jgi:hypothetical protein